MSLIDAYCIACTTVTIAAIAGALGIVILELAKWKN